MKFSFRDFWFKNRTNVALSAFCILVAIFDTFWKNLSTVAAAALAFALVPWVLHFFEKIQGPGGFEFVLAKAESKLDASPEIPSEEDIAAFKYFESSDPNLAIGMLRIQIERRLREIAEDVGIDANARRMTLGRLMGELSKQGAVSRDAVRLLTDLLPAMNEAVHGAPLQRDAVDFALNYGPKILAMLGKGGKNMNARPTTPG